MQFRFSLQSQRTQCSLFDWSEAASNWLYLQSKAEVIFWQSPSLHKNRWFKSRQGFWPSCLQSMCCRFDIHCLCFCLKSRHNLSNIIWWILEYSGRLLDNFEQKVWFLPCYIWTFVFSCCHLHKYCSTNISHEIFHSQIDNNRFQNHIFLLAPNQYPKPKKQPKKFISVL